MSHIYKFAPPKLYSSSTLRVRWRIGHGPVINRVPWPAPDPVLPPPEPVPDPPPPTQEETVEWLARLGIDAPPSADFISATNTYIARGKAHGWYQSATEHYFHGGMTRRSALEGAKGVLTYAAGTLVGTPPQLTQFGMEFDGASYWNTGTNFDALPGVSVSSFGLGMYLTSNKQSTGNWCGAFSDNIKQVSLTPSTGLKSQARLCGGTLSFGDADSLGATAAWQSGTSALCGSANSPAAVFTQTPAALPSTAFCVGRGGTVGNTYSTDCGIYTRVGAFSSYEEYLLWVDDAQEYMVNLGIWEDIQVPPAPSGPHAFDRYAINSVLPSDLRVYLLFPPPASDSIDRDTYRGFPMTDTISRSGPNVSGSTWTAPRNGHHNQFVWVPRKTLLTAKPAGFTGNLAGNPNDVNGTIRLASGFEAKQGYPSIETAMGAAIAQVAWQRGYPLTGPNPIDPLGQNISDILDQYGLDPAKFMTNAAAAAIKETLFTIPDSGKMTCQGYVITDNERQIDLDPAKFPRQSITLDIETGDGRTPAQLLEYVKRCAQIAAATGAGLNIVGFIINERSAFNSGYTLDSCWQLMADTNLTQVPLTASQVQKTGTMIESLDAQVDMYRGPAGDKPIDYSRFLLQLQKGTGAGRMTQSNAVACCAWLQANGIKHVMPSNVGALQGGPIAYYGNQLTATWLGLPLS